MLSTKRLDKLEKQIKAVHRSKTTWLVHIIEDNYCHACKGKCKYIDNEKLQIEDDAVVIIDDIPKGW